MISTAHTAAEAEALPAGKPDGGTLAASLYLGSVTRAQIEDLLYREARLLDEWDLDSWLTLWAEEGTRYVVPCNDDPDGDPSRDLVLIDDDQLRMRLRVERLNSRKAHREYPHSRTNYQVSNVVVGTAEGSGADAELPVTAAFTVWRFRNGKASCYVGRDLSRPGQADMLLRAATGALGGVDILVNNAAKGGVHGMTTGLAREFATAGITVNTVAPSYVLTPELGEALSAGTVPGRLRHVMDRATEMIPMSRPGRVDDVASMVAYLASEDAGFVTGQILSVKGGSSMG